MENAETLQVWLEALIGTNLVHLNHHPDTKPLYDSGVVYGRTDDWEPFACLYMNGYHGTDRPDSRVVKRFGVFGDCKSLACARIAELRVKGKTVKPVFRHQMQPVKAPPGTLIAQDGRIIAPDGRVIALDGSIRSDGTVLAPDGKVRQRMLYHILVQTGLDTYEDPSKICGMTDNEWSYMMT